MAKPTSKNSTPGKRGPKGPRKPLEERLQIAKAKVVDMELRMKLRDNPEHATMARQIRQLRKLPDQTPAIQKVITELLARIS